MDSELQSIDQILPILHLSGVGDESIKYWEFLLMLGFGDPDKTEQLYKSLRRKLLPEDWRMPLVEIGEARVMSIAGRNMASHERLQSASKLIFGGSNILNERMQSEITALYYFVLTTHSHKIEDNLFPISYLHFSEQLTSIDSFKEVIRFHISGHEVKWLGHPVAKMIPHIQLLESMGIYMQACLGYKWAGVLARKRSEYDEALQHFTKSSALATKMNIDYHIMLNHNAVGYLHYCQNRFQEADEEYSKIVIKNNLDPIIPILYENLALLAIAREDHEQAISLLQDAIVVSKKLDSIQHLPGELHYLGKTFENYYKDDEKAEFYYKQAFDHSMRYASHGISLTGDRKQAVDDYVRFMERHRGGRIHTRPDIPDDNFSFTGGRSWKDIKDIFHHQLICYHQQSSKSSKALANKMGLPPSTLYSIQNRLKKRGYLLTEKTDARPEDDHALYSFIEAHEEMSWEEINTIFEREIIHYLYEKYGYNKHRMAQVLQLSYPSIITKTRELTQVNDNLLPN